MPGLVRQRLAEERAGRPHGERVISQARRGQGRLGPACTFTKCTDNPVGEQSSATGRHESGRRRGLCVASEGECAMR
jgi:hypothetical protein